MIWQCLVFPRLKIGYYIDEKIRQKKQECPEMKRALFENLGKIDLEWGKH